VLQNGYWHARSLDYLSGKLPRFIEWMRIVGDTVFILAGALPIARWSSRTWDSCVAVNLCSRSVASLTNPARIEAARPAGIGRRAVLYWAPLMHAAPRAGVAHSSGRVSPRIAV
jgi:hypothetical protein